MFKLSVVCGGIWVLISSCSKCTTTLAFLVPTSTARPARHANNNAITTDTRCTSSDIIAATRRTSPCTTALLLRSSQHHAPKYVSTIVTSTTSLSALTERQMQFWEDVDRGLYDIETVYAAPAESNDSSNNSSIHRIRTFAQTAQGILPAPTPTLPGHQPSQEHVHGLTAQPFWDVTSDPVNFPWASKLQDNWHIIRQELDAKLEKDQKERDSRKRLFAGDSVWQNDVMGAGWSAFRLQRLGVWNGENCKEFPKTVELLRSLDIPFAVRGVCFARQAAKSGVQPHSDGRNFILTSHLGLKIPEGCWIRVGQEERGWEEGKLTTLDTSFEHSTGNPSEEDRHVLIIDFWHPELTEAERVALDYVYDLRNKFESGQVPFRKPKKLVESEEREGQGLAGIFSGLFGGGEKSK